MRQNTNTFHNLRCAVLHQTVIGGDIRLALGGIDNQGFNLIATATQFGASRETRTAEAGDAILVDTLNQRLAALAAIITPALALTPAIFAVGFNHDAQFR